MTATQWIFTFTFGSCLVAAAAGALALRLTRGGSLRVGIVITSLVPLIAVAGTVVVSVQVMFLSPHDTWVVLFALAASSVVAVVMAAAAASLLTRSARHVAATIREIEGDDPHGAQSGVGSSRDVRVRAVTMAPTAMPAELRAVVGELESATTRLTEARQRERALERSRRELIAFLSHDLRTPMAGIGALAEALEDDIVDDRPLALAQLRGAVNRMAGIVDDLFTLARVTDAPVAGRRAPVSLVELVEDVTGEASARAAKAGVLLQVAVPDGDRLAVTADADELTRAVANLVANAITHTTHGGSVRVDADRAPDGRIRLSVLDGCGGIDADVLEHVFEVGWQAQPARAGGAGLGLAIARGVVEAHAGRILVRNVGAGCAFDVELPASGVAQMVPEPVGLHSAANAEMPVSNEMPARQPS
jgi:signal transduction histidine kinase